MGRHPRWLNVVAGGGSLLTLFASQLQLLRRTGVRLAVGGRVGARPIATQGATLIRRVLYLALAASIIQPLRRLRPSADPTASARAGRWVLDRKAMTVSWSWSELSPLRLPLVLSAGLLGGCAFDLERPAVPVFPASAGFSAGFATTAQDPAEVWWRGAVEAPVWSLLEQALADNPQLRRADAEVQAAQARLEQATADTGPVVALRADAGVQKSSGEGLADSRAAGVDGTLPLDVSGALGLRQAAARFALEAAVADRAQLRSDLARDFVLAALDQAEASQRLVLLAAQLEVARTLLRLIELRFTQGLASGVDVLQQRDQLAALRQQVPVARLDRQTAANRLRLIGNLTPERAPALRVETLPEVYPQFAPLRPVELLERRAALRARRARLAAADADFAAALADRWPTLTLTGGALTRTASGDVTTLISAALDAAFTLFDSGGKRSIAAERRALLAAAGEQYLADWTGSVLDIDDLIQLEASLRERIDLSQQRLATARALLSATRRRYERGVSDYLPVLEALRGLQQQQRDHLALQAELARSRVRLHHAMGHPAAEDQG